MAPAEEGHNDRRPQRQPHAGGQWNRVLETAGGSHGDGHGAGEQPGDDVHRQEMALETDPAVGRGV